MCVSEKSQANNFHEGNLSLVHPWELLEEPSRNFSTKQRNLWKEADAPLLTCSVQSQSSGMRMGAVLQVPGAAPAPPPPPVASSRPRQDTSSQVVLLRLRQVRLHSSSTHSTGAWAGTLALAICLKPAAKASPSRPSLLSASQLSPLVHGNTNRRLSVPTPRLSTALPGASCQLLCVLPIPLVEAKTPNKWACPP